MTNKTIGLSDELAAYVVKVGAREPHALAQLREETATLPQHRMQIAPEEGAFLAFLVELIGAHRPLGTFQALRRRARFEHDQLVAEVVASRAGVEIVRVNAFR